MNPILIKPSGDCSSQVVVRGKIWGQISAADYHQRRVEELMPLVRESYQTLASKYQSIILEGAGSPAEINLKQSSLPCSARSNSSIRQSAIVYAASALTNSAATSACSNQESA
jgi:cobyric acid synthase